MPNTVKNVIVLSGCDNPSCGNNNPSTSSSGQDPISNPSTTSPKVKGSSPKVKENEDLDFMQATFGLSPPNFSSDSSSDSDVNIVVNDDAGNDNQLSNQRNEIPNQNRRLNYQFLQEIIDNYNDFMVFSVKQCFENLIELISGFQFACVYYDVLSFYYSSNELLSLDNITLARHFTIRDELHEIMENKFKSKLLMYLRILKELLEEEKEDYYQFNNEKFHVMLSLGTLENTKLFIKKIKNLLRNGRHLKYPSMTWYNRIISLLDELNSLDDDSHIHFLVQRYRHRDFEQYSQFKRYRLLDDGDRVHHDDD